MDELEKLKVELAEIHSSYMLEFMKQWKDLCTGKSQHINGRAVDIKHVEGCTKELLEEKLNELREKGLFEPKPKYIIQKPKRIPRKLKKRDKKNRTVRLDVTVILPDAMNYANIHIEL